MRHRPAGNLPRRSCFLRLLCAPALLAALGGAAPAAGSTPASPDATPLPHELHGTVVDDAGRPLAGVQVGRSSRAAGGPTLVETDAEGRFAFPVADGLHKLWVLGEELAPEFTQRIQVSGESVDVELRLPPPAALVGRVFGLDPGQDFLVVAWRDDLRGGPASHDFPRRGAPAADGSYRIQGLGAGTWSVKAWPRVSVGGRWAATAEVRIEPGDREVVTDLELALPRRGEVSGRVRAADGTPVAGAWIYLYPDGGGERVRTATAADGSFREAVAPGTYRLTADHRGFGATVLDAPVMVEAWAPAAGLEIFLPAPARLTGRVLGIEPFPEVSLWAQNDWVTETEHELEFDLSASRALSIELSQDGELTAWSLEPIAPTPAPSP